MRYQTKIVALFLLFANGFGAGCIDSRSANDAAVEKLRQNLISENFAEIYKRASGVTRAQLSQEEFVSKMRSTTAELKRVDPEINWTRNETILYDKSVFREDNFSSLDLANNGTRLNITLDWAPEYALCGMAILYDDSENGSGDGVMVFRNCD